MKLLGVVERDNTTLPSTPDTLGWRYRASFEFYPFHEGTDMAVYKGVINGGGPRRGEFCVVKASMNGNPTDHRHWVSLQEVVIRCQSLAQSFNQLLQVAVKFIWPSVAAIDTLSDFCSLARLLRPHEKRLKKGEMVVIEQLIEGKFQTFSSALGVVDPAGHRHSDVMQAFSHYSWYVSQGELLVTGLQGVVTGLLGVVQGRGYHLTTPTVHSRYRKYGRKDGGLASVVEFFSNHHCNNLCCSWPSLGVAALLKSPRLLADSDHQGHQPPHRDLPESYMDQEVVRVDQEVVMVDQEVVRGHQEVVRGHQEVVRGHQPRHRDLPHHYKHQQHRPRSAVRVPTNTSLSSRSACGPFSRELSPCPQHDRQLARLPSAPVLDMS